MNHDGFAQPSSQSIDNPPKRQKKNNAATGACAASVRTPASQIVTFYFRVPVKAFFRTRVDRLHQLQLQAFARAINPGVQAKEAWSLRLSTPALLAHAVRTYGWPFIPNHVLPPLAANIGVGAVLYTSYLQLLRHLHPPFSQAPKRVFPRPPPSATFCAGAAAGAVSSFVAAVPDGLSTRFRSSDMLSGKFKSIWAYSAQQLKMIGARGVFAGWGLSCAKDTLGYGLFFATFEYVKAQAYIRFVAMYYGSLRGDVLPHILKPGVGFEGNREARVTRPHYAIEPAFLGLAGVGASVVQQVVCHPVGRIQDLQYRLIQSMERQPHSKQLAKDAYRGMYIRTIEMYRSKACKAGGWRTWLYRRFWWSAIRQVPSTAAGLVVFELVRKRYGSDIEAVRIEEDGYDILLA